MTKISVIKDIFNGTRGHIETMKIPDAVQKNSGIISDTYDELKELLSSEQLKLHQKFVDALENGYSGEAESKGSSWDYLSASNARENKLTASLGSFYFFRLRKLFFNKEKIF